MFMSTTLVFTSFTAYLEKPKFSFKTLNFEWNYTQLKFKPGTVEKNESTIDPPAGIEPTLLRCRNNAPATELQRQLTRASVFVRLQRW